MDFEGWGHWRRLPGGHSQSVRRPPPASLGSEKVGPTEIAKSDEQVPPAVNLQLQSKRFDVHADRPRADVQSGGDFAISATPSHESEHLELAL